MGTERRFCVHVQHVPSKYDKAGDMHLIKERIKDADGKERPNIRLVENFKRPFYVANKDTQKTHTQKREWEYLANCTEHESTETGLAFAVQRALNLHGQRPNLKKLLDSPYVYGCDVSASVIIKHREDASNDKGHDVPYRPDLKVGILDYETDVLNGTEYIISGSFCYDGVAYVACTEDFAKKLGPDPLKAVIERANEHLKHIIDRGYSIKFKVVKDNLAVVMTLMGLAHKLQPDLLAIWNMTFDVGKMLETAKQYNLDPAAIFCDPSVPDEYRYFEYIEMPKVKRTSSGKEMPKHPAELWHKVICLASFVVVDAMCIYCMLRAMDGKEPSYSLDAILGKELNISKLKIKEVEDLNGLEWHKTMQQNYASDYLVYNAFDCISMQLLDDKTGDMQKALSSYAGISDYRNLRSNPRRLTDAFHYYLLEQGKVLCSTGKNMLVPDDDLLLNGEDWIVTLSFELCHRFGMEVDEAKALATRIAVHVFDIDITSGYPTTQLVCNISKSTTLAEICAIDGMAEVEQRRIGVNMTACNTNAVDIAQSMLGMGALDDLCEEFLKDITT